MWRERPVFVDVGTNALNKGSYLGRLPQMVQRVVQKAIGFPSGSSFGHQTARHGITDF